MDKIAIGTKEINQISRTLTAIQGSEMLPGRDENGDFKVEVSKIVDKVAAQVAYSGSYSKYYVQDTAPTINHGTLWYNTTNNKLYKYNNILSKWIEINWQEIVKATPEWQAGKLQVSSGILQIYNGSSWFDCYPMVGSKFFKIIDYTKKYYQQIGTFTAIVNSNQVPIVFAREMINFFRTYSTASNSTLLTVSNIASTGNFYHQYYLNDLSHDAYSANCNALCIKEGIYSSGVCDIMLNSSNARATVIAYYDDGTAVGVIHSSSTIPMPSTAYYLGVLNGAGTIIVERKATI